MAKNPKEYLEYLKNNKDKLIAVGIGFALAGIFASMLTIFSIRHPTGCIGYKEIKAFYTDILKQRNITLLNIKVNTYKSGDVCVHNVTLLVEEPNGKKERVLTTLFSKGGIIFMQGYDTLQKKLILAPRAQIEELFTPKKMKNVTVDLYIMSMCPFGKRAAENFFTKVPSGISFKLVPHFIISESNENKTKCEKNGFWLPAGIYYNGKCYRSLHGNGELKTDIVLYNIYHTYGYETFKKIYLDIINKCGNYVANETKLINCVKSVLASYNLSWSSLYKVSLLPEIANDSKGVLASPTVYVNGVKVPYSPINEWNEVISAICNSYTNPPEACDKYKNLIEVSS